MNTNRRLKIHRPWLTLPVLVLCAVFARAEPAPTPSRFIQRLQSGEHQTLVIFGTSLSRAGKWVHGLHAALDGAFPGQVTLYNGAEGGRNSRWGVEHVESNVIVRHPDCVFIEFAINDAVARFDLSLAESRRNMETIIDRISRECPGCEIILQIMNPVVGKHETDAGYRPRQAEYHQLYRDLVRERSMILIDHEPDWKRILQTEGEAGFLRLVPDGVHPGGEACDDLVVPRILEFLGVPRSKEPARVDAREREAGSVSP